VLGLSFGVAVLVGNTILIAACWRMPAGVALVLLFGLLLWRGIRIGDLSRQILSASRALAFGRISGER
jgi:hypothetical protein